MYAHCFPKVKPRPCDVPLRDATRSEIIGFKHASVCFHALRALRQQVLVVQSQLADLLAGAANRRVIGSINKFGYQLFAYVGQTSDPLEITRSPSRPTFNFRAV
jgi:hypothetical protein